MHSCKILRLQLKYVWRWNIVIFNINDVTNANFLAFFAWGYADVRSFIRWIQLYSKPKKNGQERLFKHFLSDQSIIPRKTLQSFRIYDVTSENINLCLTAEWSCLSKNCLWQVTKKYYALILRQSCSYDLNSPLKIALITRCKLVEKKHLKVLQWTFEKCFFYWEALWFSNTGLWDGGKVSYL